jgi:hypothetical protein
LRLLKRMYARWAITPMPCFWTSQIHGRPSHMPKQRLRYGCQHVICCESILLTVLFLQKHKATKICTFSPCIEQIQQTVKELVAQQFEDLFMVEVLVRKHLPSQIKTPQGLLPVTFVEPEMKGHTSYLLFATHPASLDINND